MYQLAANYSIRSQIALAKLEALCEKMSSCCQTPGQTILQHGEAVSIRFKDLIGERRMEWRLPDWFDLDFLLPLCPDLQTMETYQVYHDCSKPDVLVISEDGRRHFPNHAMMSAAKWLSIGGDKLIGRLMEHDMDMHTMKPAEIGSYKHFDLAPALLLTALCELHANAEMFGGLESTSFKIKWKALNKLGKAFVSSIRDSEQAHQNSLDAFQSPCMEGTVQS